MKGFLDEEALKRIRPVYASIGEYATTPVIFLDRDGVINRRMPPHEHVTKWEDFDILPDVYEGIRILNEYGFPIILISNQRCIALGTLTMDGLNDINYRMIQDFKEHGVYVDGFYFCPHGLDDNCDCRKPKCGLLCEAEEDLRILGIDVDKSRSWMVGDADTDIQAGQSYGIKTLMIGSEGERSDEGVKNLLSAARQITERITEE